MGAKLHYHQLFIVFAEHNKYGNIYQKKKKKKENNKDIFDKLTRPLQLQ